MFFINFITEPTIMFFINLITEPTNQIYNLENCTLIEHNGLCLICDRVRNYSNLEQDGASVQRHMET